MNRSPRPRPFKDRHHEVRTRNGIMVLSRHRMRLARVNGWEPGEDSPKRFIVESALRALPRAESLGEQWALRQRITEMVDAIWEARS